MRSKVNTGLRLSEVGEPGQDLSGSMWRLDGESGRWELQAQLPAPRSHHCLAVLGGFIYAAGGSASRDNDEDAACDRLHRYDPRLEQWTEVRGSPASSPLRASCADPPVS